MFFISLFLFVPKIFRFLSWFFGHTENNVQNRKQITTIHLLPNISRSESSPAIKFGQLIEYNMRNIFLEKSYTKCGGETSPRFISRKSKLSISLNKKSEILYSLFLFYVQVEDCQNMFNLSRG